jgi:hypothetical protein
LAPADLHGADSRRCFQFKRPERRFTGKQACDLYSRSLSPANQVMSLLVHTAPAGQVGRLSGATQEAPPS